jgi:hypothetical protein
VTLGKKMTSRAVTLRELALKAMRERGTWEKADPINLMMLRHGEITIGHRTPFQRQPEPNQKTKYYLALLGGPEPLPFGLDVWHGRKKVLGIEWDMDGRVVVMSFTPGDWEAELEHLVARST